MGESNAPVTMHYHGTPISPRQRLLSLAGRCFCVSFAEPRDIEVAHEIGQSVMLDNGAFSVWKRGETPDWPGYYEWCSRWLAWRTTWAVIPDVIDGDVDENDLLIAEWPHGDRGAPVWHMHEPIDRLCALAADWPRVCIGSSGRWRTLGTPDWHRRMARAMDALCGAGAAPTWLHMLRGTAQADGPYPFASVDSTDIAQNAWREGNTPQAMADRWDAIQCGAVWTPTGEQLGLEGVHEELV